MVGCWRGYLSGARCTDADLHMAHLMPLSLTVSSLATVKSRFVLPFWYRLTRVVLEKGPLNGCTYVRMYVTMLSPYTVKLGTFEINDIAAKLRLNCGDAVCHYQRWANLNSNLMHQIPNLQALNLKSQLSNPNLKSQSDLASINGKYLCNHIGLCVGSQSVC